MTVWVVFNYDLITPTVHAIYATEIEARRAVDGGAWAHVRELVLPCADVKAALEAPRKAHVEPR